MMLKQWRPRAAVIAGSAMVTLVLSAGDASAEYRAWFSDWDYVGDFQAGDLSEGFTEMVPPEGACGLRILDPSYYRWTNDVDGTVSSNDLYKDVIVWVDPPGGDNCSRPFSVRYHDDSHTFQPPAGGAVAMEIFTNYAAYWVKDDGSHLYTCGGCALPGHFAIEPDDIDWLWLSTARTFTALSASAADLRRQVSVAGSIAAAALDVSRLQTTMQKRIAERRRSAPVGKLEGTVRTLEDAAARALAAARAAASACEASARSGAYTEAFLACSTADHHVERSRSQARAAHFLAFRYYQPGRTK